MSILRRRGWIAAAFLLLIPPAVYVQSARQPKVYAASIVLEGDPGERYVPVGRTTVFNPRSATTALSYVGTPAVARETARVVAERFGTTATVSGGLDTRTGWLTLTATGPEPAVTTATAGVSASVLRRALRRASDEELEQSIIAAERDLRVLRDPGRRSETSDQLAAFREARRERLETLRVIQPASPATVVAPDPGRNTALAVILALLVAPGLILLVQRYDRTVRRPRQLEALVGRPVLAKVPAEAFADVPAGGDRAFARLRDGLTHFELGAPLRSLVVASPLRREGRTTIVAELGMAFARAGHRVVLVDADFREHALAQRLGAAPSIGLAGVLGGAPLEEALRVVGDRDAELRVLPAGDPLANLEELLASEQMSSLLQALTDEFDVVIVDTPPLLAVSDAVAILRHVSGVLCVARAGQTPRPAVSRMCELATAAGGRILGTVLTGARSSRRKRRYRESTRGRTSAALHRTP